jgi:hypothetical protein
LFSELAHLSKIGCECGKAKLVLRGDKGVKIIENGTITTLNETIAYATRNE